MLPFFIINQRKLSMENISNINWSEVVEKEARGINDDDLGEVQSVEDEYVVTQAGVVDKITYHLPKNLVKDYDGHNLLFRITKEEAKSKYGID
jgi:hypothetical protein